MADNSGFYITNSSKGGLPRLPFGALKDAVLGKKYELSLVFTTPLVSRRLNKTYRKKDKAANVLSFSYSKNEGEIIICPAEARREAKKFGRNFDSFIPFLYVHGLFHLKGFSHGSTMEKKEAAILKKFGLEI